MFHEFLRLNKFDIGYLRPWRRRNKEEERQNEQRCHEGEVTYVRTAGRFRQFDDHVRIDFATLERSMIVGIAHSIGYERNKEAEEND